MDRQKYSTFFLFKQRGSFLTGIATILNIRGDFFHYNYSETGEDADTKAIENDWGVVGQDIQGTIKSISKKNLQTISDGRRKTT